MFDYEAQLRNYIPTYVPGSSASTVPAGTTFVAVQQASGNPQQVQQAYTIQQAPLTYVTQAVVSTHQIVASGYMSGTPVAVTPTAYLTPATVVHASSPHGYHPYQQVRQVNIVSASPKSPSTACSSVDVTKIATPAAAQPQQQQQSIAVAVTAQNYTALPLQTVSYAAPSTSQPQQAAASAATPIITDPGRTIVQAPKPVEPVFVAPSNSVQIKRVLHSEVYLKYIESMCSQQRTVSKYSRGLLANQRNTTPAQKGLPTQWLKEAKEGGTREEDVVRALWRLRDALLESTVDIAREVNYTGPL